MSESYYQALSRLEHNPDFKAVVSEFKRKLEGVQEGLLVQDGSSLNRTQGRGQVISEFINDLVKARDFVNKQK